LSALKAQQPNWGTEKERRDPTWLGIDVQQTKGETGANGEGNE